uniref:Cytochrome P450 monooxygenase FCK2 n=1 Tax=Fusarium pseudograminearum (strain CS3096) TaxID=1028729 RepID=FCK2_FUSPC|nr:RecName: Full=Cytochrome P450 monooxygenase FCK2; AltName: Full=Cytokinin biosynthesis protein 2 [Fusarium pseudograminearum CS3096]
MATLHAYFDPANYSLFFVLGVLTHVFIFRRGEWDLHVFNILQAFAVLESSLVYIVTRAVQAQGLSLWKVTTISSCFTLSTLMGLLISILMYRSWFHRLRRFPGPFCARLSNLYITFRAFKKNRLYEEVQQLHRRYGDIVRIGPNELSIIDPHALRALHSNSSPCTKGPWYSVEHPIKALQMTRDKEEHAYRRKAWDLAFSSKALREYEARVAGYTTQLVDQIEASQSTPIDASLWFNFYSFDVMGDLAFGRTFDMLKNGTAHPFMELVHSNMLTAGSLSHLPWIFPLLKRIPLLNQKTLEFQGWLKQQVDWRQKNNPDLPDVFSWILSDYDALDKPTAQDTINLRGDAQLIAVAGSDTTAASLSCLFSELAVNPETCLNLQRELDQYHAEHDKPDHLSLSKLRYLQACIDESMRLYPAIPSGLQRMTPPEGLDIGNTYLPGDTIVTIPTYTFNRDERLFTHADKFIPERWTTKKELTKDPSNFVPFSIGQYSCVGKQLGLMETRFVASQILVKYNVRLAHEDVARDFVAGLRDGFTLAMPSLSLVFTQRTT